MLHLVSDKKYQEIIKKEAELKEFEKYLNGRFKELKLIKKDVDELVDDARSYMGILGITDAKLERIKTKNKFKVL